MDPCMKTLRKIPMAMVGAVDLVICTAMKAGNCLAKRGEKVWSRWESECLHARNCTCEPHEDQADDFCASCAKTE